ncbi:MAG: metallopeptidase family protein [candidate division WOR-3 bacterium]
MTREDFEEAIKESLKKLPKILRDKLVNVEFVIEDKPIPQKNLLGLYQGVPLKKRGFWYGNVLPDKITLFKYNIENFTKNDDEAKRLIYEVLLHEIGHYFGFDETELQDMASHK